MADDKVHIPGVQEVVRNGKQNWQVMHAKKYHGFFPASDDALKAKDKAMGMAPATLKSKYMKSSRSGKSDEPQQFKGLTQIKRGDKCLWQVQDTVTHEYLGIVDTVARQLPS